MKLLRLALVAVNIINGELDTDVRRNTIMIDGLLKETLIDQKDAIARLTNELETLKTGFVDYQKVLTHNTWLYSLQYSDNGQPSRTTGAIGPRTVISLPQRIK